MYVEKTTRFNPFSNVQSHILSLPAQVQNIDNERHYDMVKSPEVHRLCYLRILKILQDDAV